MKKETWVDAVKILACILVVIGHFFQSMVASEIVSRGKVYDSFMHGIYTFHVPLFLICSGFLYQLNSCVSTIGEWKQNVIKKIISLGVPYLAFSLITWGLKRIFAGSVNNQVDNLFKSLFVTPLSPYWYLYCLILIFLITPTFYNHKCAFVIVLISFAMKVVSLFCDIKPYALSVLFSFYFWFVIGMIVCRYVRIHTLSCSKKVGFIGAMIVLGDLLYCCFGGMENCSNVEAFVFGITVCIGILLCAWVLINQSEMSWIRFMAKYTMPIFLMHTIFAASFRSVLLKFEIVSVPYHVIGGMVISFVGPMIASEIMNKSRLLDFWMYPLKYVNIPAERKKQKTQ